MLSTIDFKYFQPEWYHDDDTNIDYGGMPDGLWSFQAFPTEEECRQWLINHDYEPGDFVIHEYCNDDIEDVTLIDSDGDIIPKIESLEDDEIEEILTNEVLLYAGSMDNLRGMRQSDETEAQFEERVYTEACDEVHSAIESIEGSGDYDFSSYGGNPDIEWYDGAFQGALERVMAWILGEE